MVIKDPCGICKGSVHRNHRSVLCDICNLWFHIGCNFILPSTYEKLKIEYSNDDIPDNEKNRFHFSTCLNNELPFGNQNDTIFYSVYKFSWFKC